jgi:hypothetical protein
MKTGISLLVFAFIASGCGDDGAIGNGATPRRPRADRDAGTSTTNGGVLSGTIPNSGSDGTGSSSGPTPPTEGGGATPPVTDAGSTPPVPAAPAVASNVTISEISINQAVKIPLMKNGTKVAVKNAPVAANRNALVRVAVTRDAAYKGQAITAELRLKPSDGAAKIFTDTKVVPATVVEGTLASTYNFEVPGEALPVGVQMSVALLDPKAPAGSQGTPGAKYPAGDSAESLDAQSTGAQLKVVLVPFRYQTDGSGRLPDTSEPQLEIYRTALYEIYPAAKVDVTVHAPYTFSRATIRSNGDGFDAALEDMQDLRAADKVANDVYYYGVFEPTASFRAFCGNGCVVGLSGLAGPRSAGQRASVGVGFPGRSSADTAAHEIGHAHGREHSPGCGAGGPDPRFPSESGSIISLGYGLVSKKLHDPAKVRDFMGYCDPTFVSDFSYKALFERMKVLSNAPLIRSSNTEQVYRRIRVGANGALTLRGTLALDTPISGEPREVIYLDASGAPVATVMGTYSEYDHLPGGYILAPEGPAGFTSARIAGMGDAR